MQTLQLPQIFDERGNLSIFQNDLYFPFKIKQVSWMWTSDDVYYNTEVEAADSNRVIVLLAGKLSLQVSCGNAGYSEITLHKNLNCISIPLNATCQVKFCSRGTLAFLASDKPFSEKNSLTNIFGRDEKSVVYS